MLDGESSQGYVHDSAGIDKKILSNFILNAIQIYKGSMEENEKRG